ncbi:MULTISPECIES: DUF4278 domain-containing protein [Trichocoleus]|uniref:DUF4278 domain-containing protein n=1 Tax=Trichocoleus desertorum GB2-A4 TaxID=2933944 RepID=A0ABV0JGP3_9CYAN|nr:DUF4278 domain-containing protein [Trichocoleus sp. FACHB-46]MBD1865655.1 DUF4278 domain-containing protein [Trichocoleus sp. FACHB-46]
MKLRYRGVGYEIAQAVPSQPMSVTPVTLIYRGNSYQSNQHQLMPHGIGSQHSMTNQSPQITSLPRTIARPQLIYRGAAYTP